jgi:hypothetical protein
MESSKAYLAGKQIRIPSVPVGFRVPGVRRGRQKIGEEQGSRAGRAAHSGCFFSFLLGTFTEVRHRGQEVYQSAFPL